MKPVDTRFPCPSTHAAFRIDLPVVHPIEVIAAISEGSARTENCCLARPTRNDRNPEFSGRALLHENSNVNLTITIEVPT